MAAEEVPVAGLASNSTVETKAFERGRSVFPSLFLAL
jgi:hypothetical protein